MWEMWEASIGVQDRLLALQSSQVSQLEAHKTSLSGSLGLVCRQWKLVTQQGFPFPQGGPQSVLLDLCIFADLIGEKYLNLVLLDIFL